MNVLANSVSVFATVCLCCFCTTKIK